MGLEAATKALLDAGVLGLRYSLFSQGLINDGAGITYDLIETAVVGYCYGDSTSGQVSVMLLSED